MIFRRHYIDKISASLYGCFTKRKFSTPVGLKAGWAPELVFVLFVYGLFKDSVSNSDCIASNRGEWLVNNKLEIMLRHLQ
jgi:hypothetical protein